MQYNAINAKVAAGIARDYLARIDSKRPLYDEYAHHGHDDHAFNCGAFMHSCRTLTEQLEAAVARIAELESAADQREVA